MQKLESNFNHDHIVHEETCDALFYGKLESLHDNGYLTIIEILKQISREKLCQGFGLDLPSIVICMKFMFSIILEPLMLH